RGVRPASADDDPDAERDPRRDLPGTAGRVLLLPQRQGPAGEGDRGPPGADVGGAGRPRAGRGGGGRGPRRGVRDTWIFPALLRAGRRRAGRGRRPDGEAVRGGQVGTARYPD